MLGLERVGLDDNLINLGGQSLGVMMIRNLIASELGIEVPISELFTFPTARELARTINRKIHGQQTEMPPIDTLQDIFVPSPASFQQEQIWILCQVKRQATSYNLPFSLRIKGPLNRLALKKSFVDLLHRHTALRTVFRQTEYQLEQLVIEKFRFFLPETDLREGDEADRKNKIDQMIAEEEERPFDLRHDLLLRAQVLRLGVDDYILLITAHHIAVDGWSVRILFEDFNRFYRARCAGVAAELAPLSLHYVHYAAWQRKWLQGDVLAKQLSYWTNKLGSASPLHGLLDKRDRSAVFSYRGAHHIQLISSSLFEAAKGIGEALGATPFVVLQAAFAVVLHKAGGASDVVMGTVVAGRLQREVESLVGMFVNTVVLRSSTFGNPTFKEFLLQSRQMVVEALAHQSVPFEVVVAALNPKRTSQYHPVFQIMFAFQGEQPQTHEADATDTFLGDLSIEYEAPKKTSSKFDLTLQAAVTRDELHLDWEYCPDLFNAQAIHRFAQSYEQVLREIVANPLLPMDRLLAEFSLGPAFIA